MDISIIKTDGGLESQKSLLKRADSVVDLTDIRGLKYCSKISTLEKVKRRLLKVKPSICFLGSGDFHHLSFLLLNQVYSNPILVLIDHHSDMFKTFPGTISCGSWVLQALQAHKIKKCIVIGNSPDDEAYRYFKEKKQIVNFYSETFSYEYILERVLKELDSSSGPIYVSIDKDVLLQGDAETNWDQGSMTLEELLDLLHHIKETDRLAGVDICGEWPVPDIKVLYSETDMESIKINERANMKILDTLLH